ncbi:MAG: putative glycoside hydrolase [Candidatus Staskawiczbacteria bacterium]|jgi:hypothetical protein
MEFSRWKIFLVAFMVLEILAVDFSLILNNNSNFSDQVAAVSESIKTVSSNAFKYTPPQKLSNPPEIIKAIYVTGYSAGSKKYLNYLSNLFINTEINAVVIDIKGSSGEVFYASGVPDVKKYNLYRGAIKNIDNLVKFFHEKNIYVIGRIAVFEDPLYAKARPEIAVYDKNNLTLWQDNNKLFWLDPASKDAWDYNIALAKDAFYHGFDEINFDYVRFPSDGKTKEAGYPFWDRVKLKSDVINEFFHYLREQLAREKISVDLFGQVTTNKDDMGIGQLLESSFENFDYISPMIYPSHYVKNFMKFANPAEHPYEVVKYAMSTALARQNTFYNQKDPLVIRSKFRPWLQDFDMGASYTADMIKAEIKATQDALGGQYNGFMLWNAANIYTQTAVPGQN